MRWWRDDDDDDDDGKTIFISLGKVIKNSISASTLRKYR